MIVEAYRAKWDLPESYPITAPSYSARRTEISKPIVGKVGLGTRLGRGDRAMHAAD